MKLINYHIKAYFFVGFLGLIATVTLNAQDQKVADSLRVEYETKELTDSEKMHVLHELAFNEITDLNLSLGYSNKLIALAIKNNDYVYLYRGYLQKGGKHRLLGDMEMALEAFFNAAEAAIKASYIAGIGLANTSIADTYSEMGNSDNAQLYYAKAIELLRQTDDTVALATALINAGDEAFNNENYELALEYFDESGTIFKNEEYLVGSAYNLGNIGMVYAEQGKDSLAMKHINEALDILTDMEDYYSISEYLMYMANIYQKRGDFNNAQMYAERSLHLAETYGLKKQISETNLLLSELHEGAGNLNNAFNFYKNHIVYRDSINNLKTIEQANDLRTNFEISQRETQLELAEQKRTNQRNILFATIIALALLGLLALGLFNRNKFIRKTKKIIEEERDLADSLLLNILPEDTANELKRNGSVMAKRHESVTVLFTDFKGFTSYSEKLSPEALVKTIGFYFSKFDDIVEKHGLEKIKTIGDAYMCAGGLSNNKEDHAHKMIEAANEIIEFVKQTKADDTIKEFTFDIRVGINTGPVVAGVVGKKKFAYDIWGDTVNVASRMESMSIPGKINISENTYEIIKSEWNCEYRGEIEVKNRGHLKMYFVQAKD